MSFLIQNNNLYDTQGNVLAADEQGIIKLVIDNQERRFKKDKFLTYLTRNPGFLKAIKPIRTDKPPKRKKVIHAPRIKAQPKEKKEIRKVRQGFEVTAVKNGITYGPFISLASCARSIGLTKATVSKIIAGRITGSKWSFIKK